MQSRMQEQMQQQQQQSGPTQPPESHQPDAKYKAGDYIEFEEVMVRQAHHDKDSPLSP